MRRARSQLNKLTQQQAGNSGYHNAQGSHTNGVEVDEIQRRLNAMQHQQNMMAQQPYPMFNEPSQNFGFPQPMQSAGFHQPQQPMHTPMQPYPTNPMGQQPVAQQPVLNAYAPAYAAPEVPVMDNFQQQTSREAANPQLDNIKSALEQMSSKLHAINHANASGGNNNQNAILQQSEILKQHYNHINNELQGLKASIAGITSNGSSNSELQIIQETLAANYQAIMQQLENAQPAQIDHSIFSAALEASHKDLSQQILDMKQSIDTSANNPNIYATTLEASHEDITKRLDDMHNALQASIASPDLYVSSIEKNHSDLSQQILNLQDSVEKLENSPSEAMPTDLSSVEMRLEEITRAVVALSLEDGSINNLERIEARVSDMAKTLDGFSVPEAKSDDASFERLEAKLSDISNLMQASSPDLSNIEAEIAKVSERFENFSAVSLASPISGEENNALLKRMDQLVEQISQSQMQSNESLSSDAITAQLQQISGAIDKLSAPVVSASSANSNNDVIVQQLDQIAGAIDQLSASSSESMSSNQFASLEQQLSLISNQMEGSVSSGALSLDPITSRLAGIEEQLGANRDITIELATKAAEDAVKMSVEAMPKMAASGIPMDSAALNSMSDILSQLNQETQQNNSKNIEAFGAVTQTLNAMVERLGSIEAGLSGQAISAPIAQPAMPSEPMQNFVEPVAEPAPEAELTPAEAFEEPEVKSKSPAADLVKAARLAAEADQALPEVPHTMALKEPILDTMSDIQQPILAEQAQVEENITLPDVETPQMAMERLPEVSDEPLSESRPDVALEPGTGGPDLAALVRQANERRKNNKGADIESAGTDFIAAARRAAQAAAQEAGAVEEEIEENTKKSLFSSLPELFAKRKKVIIMAAAAALFIAVAGTIVPKFFGGDEQIAAVDNSQTIEQSANPVLPQASAVPPQNIVTPIEPTPEAQDFVTTSQQEIAAPQTDASDLTQEVNLAAVDLNTAQQVSSFDIPAELDFVTDDLKQAVQNGEPAALFEVGKIYTDGAGVDKDLAKAAQWYENAADLGFAPAQYIIGNFNEKGLGVNQDAAIAAQWYEKAAKGGNIIAMHNLAVLTATPNALSKQPNMEEAFKWFSNAADYGVRDSQVNAGIFHTKGFGTEVNLIEAYKWFSIAAKAGDKDASNKRDVIANAIQPDQLEIAKSLVKEWKPLDVVQAANEVPQNAAWKSTNPVAKAPLKIDRNTIAQTQSLLSKVGFNAGVADGVMGQKTRNAIAAFQKQAGLPVNGRIDAEFLRALKAVAI